MSYVADSRPTVTDDRPRVVTTTQPDPSSIPAFAPDIGEEEVAAVANALRSGWLSSGPIAASFEQDFAEFLGGGVEAVALSSATAGLHLAIEACGVGPGDEVIVPTWTFTATAAAALRVGARPVLVDVDPLTLNLDVDRVAGAITNHTKAVIPVHMAGLGCDMVSLSNLLEQRGIHMIEDAAHALPTRTGGSLVGQCELTSAAVFSFYATKTVTTGEGGMITTRNPEIARRARLMRSHGMDRDLADRSRKATPSWAYDIVVPGYKYNLPDPLAAMGRVQLRRALGMQQRRQAVADRYLAELAYLPLQLPQPASGGDTHAWHLFVIRLRSDATIGRDDFVRELATRAIGSSVHYKPLHLHSFWQKHLNVRPDQFPVATEQFRSAVTLPLFSTMTDEQVTRVISAVKEILS